MSTGYEENKYTSVAEIICLAATRPESASPLFQAEVISAAHLFKLIKSISS